MEKLDLNKIENELTNFNRVSKEIDKICSNINKVENQINFNQATINLEKELRKYSSQAIGSVLFYNQLNEKRYLFVDSQFNKTIRFLEHIENKEKKYRDLYVNCTKNYLTTHGIPIDELKNEKKEIDDCYNLISILVSEVNEDTVKFNKVYNKLEDAGLFMTLPEKINQQYLSEISSKLDSVILGLKVLFNSIEEANRSLRDIEGYTSEIAANTYDISEQLWDISSNLKEVDSSIKFNNLLTAIQTYQLYKINKNTKPNKKT